MYRLTAVLSFVAFAVLFIGCDSNPTGPDIPTIEETDFAASLNVDLSEMTETSSGLYYRDLEAGSGNEATAGDEVDIRYTGWLADGTRFDSNADADQPLTFVLAAGRVIQGFDEGVTGMQEGGHRQIVIPPHLGYGNQPVGTIPPNSILVFEIELEETRQPSDTD